MEELHAEGDSPRPDLDPDVPRSRETRAAEHEASSDEDAELFVECPIEGCLEQISLAELEDHVDFHAIEQNEESTSLAAVAAAVDVAPSAAADPEYRSPYSRPEEGVARSDHRHGRERPRSPTSHDGAVDAWKKIFGRKHIKKVKDLESKHIDGRTLRKRLGVRFPHLCQRRLQKHPSKLWNLALADRRCKQKSELGKHAYEHQMPDSLVALLRRGKYTSAEGSLVSLISTFTTDSTTSRSSCYKYAYL